MEKDLNDPDLQKNNGLTSEYDTSIQGINIRR